MPNVIRAVLGIACSSMLASSVAMAQGAPTLPPPTLPPSDASSVQSDSSGAGAAMIADTTARLSGGLRACAGRKMSDDRLHCFDTLAATLPMAADTHAQNPGAWVMGVGSAGIASTLTTSTADGMENVQASAFVKCKGGQLQAYVTYGIRVVPVNAQLADVTIRVDDGDTPLGTSRWKPSQSGRAVGLWTTTDSGEFIRRLMTAQRLKVRLDMPDEKILLATFETKGADTALTPVMATCGTK